MSTPLQVADCEVLSGSGGEGGVVHAIGGVDAGSSVQVSCCHSCQRAIFLAA